MPAPFSTPTSAPAATSFLTDSGANATRASPCCCSLGTAILICPFPLSAKLGMVHPKYPGETLFLKAHIYKSMTLNGRACADCDEDHRRLRRERFRHPVNWFVIRMKAAMETCLCISPCHPLQRLSRLAGRPGRGIQRDQRTERIYNSTLCFENRIEILFGWG